MVVLPETKSNALLREIISRIEIHIWVFNQSSIGFVTTYMIWFCIDAGLDRIHLHAFLVTIGFSFLMAEGIMCHYSINPLTFGFNRKAKNIVHGVLMVLGGGCGVAGALIMLIPLDFHFSSTHTKLGFAAFILCLVNMLAGVVSLFSGTLKKWLSPLINKAFHNLLGIGVFLTALLAQFYGYYFLHDINPSFRTVLQVTTLTSLVLTSIGPFKAFYQKCTTYFA